MLMTPIWPKMIASPSAMSSRTQKTESPLKPCIAMIAPNSENHSISRSQPYSRATEVIPTRLCAGHRPHAMRLLITLRERIGLDQIRLVDHLELPVLLRDADSRLAPEMVVRMNLHVALRRGLKLDARGSGGDLVDVEAAGF